MIQDLEDSKKSIRLSLETLLHGTLLVNCKLTPLVEMAVHLCLKL